jgi:hypothetical protein
MSEGKDQGLSLLAAQELEEHTNFRVRVLVETGLVQPNKAKDALRFLRRSSPAVEQVGLSYATRGLLLHGTSTYAIQLWGYPDEEVETDPVAKEFNAALLRLDVKLIHHQRRFKQHRHEATAIQDWMGDIRADALAFAQFRPDKNLVADLASSVAVYLAKHLVEYDLPFPANIETVLGAELSQHIRDEEAESRKHKSPDWLIELLAMKAAKHPFSVDVHSLKDQKAELEKAAVEFGDLTELAKQVLNIDELNLLVRLPA